MVLTQECWGNNCQIVQCLENKGLKFCYQCSEYEKDACEKFMKLAQRYAKIGVNVKANLERTKMAETENGCRRAKINIDAHFAGNPYQSMELKGNVITVEVKFQKRSPKALAGQRIYLTVWLRPYKFENIRD